MNCAYWILSFFIVCHTGFSHPGPWVLSDHENDRYLQKMLLDVVTVIVISHLILSKSAETNHL